MHTGSDSDDDSEDEINAGDHGMADGEGRGDRRGVGEVVWAPTAPNWVEGALAPVLVLEGVGVMEGVQV